MMMSPDGWNTNPNHRYNQVPSLRGAPGGSVAKARQAALVQSQSAPALELRKVAVRPVGSLSPLGATSSNTNRSPVASSRSTASNTHRSPVASARSSTKSGSPSRGQKEATKRQKHLLKYFAVARIAALLEKRLHEHKREKTMALFSGARPKSTAGQGGGASTSDKIEECIHRLHAAGFGAAVQRGQKRRAARIMLTFLTEFAHDVMGADNTYGVGLHTIRLAIFRIKKILCKVQRGIRGFVVIQAARRKLLARKWAEVYRSNLPRLSKFRAKLQRDWKRKHEAPPETPWIADQMRQMMTVQRRANKLMASHEKKKLKLMKQFACEERKRLAALERENRRDRARSRTVSNESVASSVLLEGLDTQRSFTSLTSTANTLSSTTLQTTMIKATTSEIDAVGLSSYSSEALKALPFTSAQRDDVCAKLLTETRRQFFIDCISGSEEIKKAKQSALEKASGNAAYNIEDALRMMSEDGYLEEQLGLKKDVKILDANKWPPFLMLERIGEKEILKCICRVMLEHFNATNADPPGSPSKSKHLGAPLQPLTVGRLNKAHRMEAPWGSATKL